MSSAIPSVHVFDLAMSLARAVDLMNSKIGQHHARVAYLAYRLASELGMDDDECVQIGLAGLLHDIGAFSLQERLDLLEFEVNHAEQHARVGHLLLRTFRPFEHIADLIRFHHVPWNFGAGATVAGQSAPLGSQVLQVADRLEILIEAESHILHQVRGISECITVYTNIQFNPDVVAAAKRLAAKEYVWLEAASPLLESRLCKLLRCNHLMLSPRDFADFAALLCRIVDFKSEFTATHSTGVAAAAAGLASLAGLSDDECELMRLAAYLHDVGKLAIPSEIIEKDGPLSETERDIMRSHAYYTYQILESVDGLEAVANWSALHQERLDGSGYPFHYTADDLSLGARIMAVADVFTALTEDRPYRAGMPKEQALRSLNHLGTHGKLDAPLLELLATHYDRLNAVRADAQRAAGADYRAFVAEVESGAHAV